MAVLTSCLNGNRSLTDVASVKQLGFKPVACLDLRCNCGVASGCPAFDGLTGYFSSVRSAFLFNGVSR